ncbi:MAG TPA: hypothetical protein VMG40_16450 [Bryobacteraceae bacterium]|nr:hypothetical protein [Bryobacteraceae bacterium]
MEFVLPRPRFNVMKCQLCEALLANYQNAIQVLVPLSRRVIEAAGNFDAQEFDIVLEELRLAQDHCETARLGLRTHQHAHAASAGEASPA